MSEIRISSMVLTDTLDVLTRIADGQQVDRALVRQVLRELQWAKQNTAEGSLLSAVRPDVTIDTALQDDLQAKITHLEEQLAMRGQTIQRQPEYQALQRELTALRDRIHQPGFWTLEFAAKFAESLEDMEDAQQRLEFASTADVLQTFEAWHLRMREGIEQLLLQDFNQSTAEQLRRDLIVQWVYLRWLEITYRGGEAR